jgi:hypothetical protein
VCKESNIDVCSALKKLIFSCIRSHTALHSFITRVISTLRVCLSSYDSGTVLCHTQTHTRTDENTHPHRHTHTHTHTHKYSHGNTHEHESDTHIHILALFNAHTYTLSFSYHPYLSGVHMSMSWMEFTAHLADYRNPFLSVQLLPRFLEPEDYIYKQSGTCYKDCCIVT